MIKEYRYKLDKSSRKFTCPACSKHRFVRYVDSEDGSYVPPQYGRCDREAECAYHLNPYSDGYTRLIQDNVNNPAPAESALQRQTKLNTTPKSITYIPTEILKETRRGYDQNIFIQNLLNHIPYPVEKADIEKVIVLYELGTVCHGYMSGAVTLPYIDEMKNIRAIQVKKFDETNHTTSTTFLHALVEQHCALGNKPLPGWLNAYKSNELKVSCLFGAHLLSKYPKNPVALVEAPKTAIIGTLYFGFPDVPSNMLWLAVYNLSSLTAEKCKALQGRTVILFPDLSANGTAFRLWNKKAKEIEKALPGTRFIVSDLLEQKANTGAKAKALDLADFLINCDWRQFRSREPSPQKPIISEATAAINFPHNAFMDKPDWEIIKVFQYDIADLQYDTTERNPPLKPAAGKLKELEDTFIRLTQQRKKHRVDYTSIISLFDKYKRVYPTDEQLVALESMLKP